MEHKKFNPAEWLPVASQSATLAPLQPAPKLTPRSNPQAEEEVAQLISQIETQGTDLTAGYERWLRIGFALASSFGENGRDFFHRISRFHPEYSVSSCNEQYTACLKSNGQGITLKTLFGYAKEAGILLPHPVHKSVLETDSTAIFPLVIYNQLPGLLQQAVAVATTDEERDLLLLGALATLSVCFQKVTGLYDGNIVHSNLFLFVVAKASAGKGRLVHCRQLVAPIHKQMREEAKILKSDYEIKLAAFNAQKGKNQSAEKPVKPPEKMLFIPANNSASGVFQLLSDNDAQGLIFETEGDTLTQAFKTDYGNYSDGFRKAFHHETISYYRRTDREYVDMERPCLSAVLSGTPGQVSLLIPSAENGLFSRFMFYYMNISPDFKNVFEVRTDHGLKDYFDTLGNQVFQLYQSVAASRGIRFSLGPAQEEDFLSYFRHTQAAYFTLYGVDYMATVRRLGLITFRIAMLLSTLRILDTGELPEMIVCKDADYQTARAITEVLMKHAAKVFSELPEEQKPVRRKNQKERFLEALPATFNRQKYLALAAELKINDKTAERYITQFVNAGLIHRDSKDNYANPANSQAADIVECEDE